MLSFAHSALMLCLLTALALPGYAQSGAAPLPIVSPGTRTRTTTQTVTAIVDAINLPMRTVILRAVINDAQMTTLSHIVAIQDIDCQPIKENHTATLADFTIGEQVVARLTWRTAPEHAVILRELYDTISYTERQRENKDICLGVIISFSPTELIVRRADGITISFRISEKTRLIKNDAPAFLSQFPTGTRVAVKPRRLPNGDLLAALVGSTAQEVIWAYQDTLSTWKGTITNVQGDYRNGAVITLQRDDGANRRFLLPVGAQFTQGRTVLSWQFLTGATVSVHLIKDAQQDGMRYADTVKITKLRTQRFLNRALPMQNLPQETLEEP